MKHPFKKEVGYTDYLEKHNEKKKFFGKSEKRS
jgi:hypothetical protein